jgi:hypothetical protein
MADSQVKTNSRFQCKIYVHLDFLQNQTLTTQRKMWYGDSPLDPTRQINFCCTSNSISYCLPALPSDGCPVRGWGHCSRVTKKRHRQTSGCHSHSYDQIERHEVITHNRHRRAKLIWSICHHFHPRSPDLLVACLEKLSVSASRDGRKMDLEIWEALSCLS